MAFPEFFYAQSQIGKFNFKLLRQLPRETSVVIRRLVISNSSWVHVNVYHISSHWSRSHRSAQLMQGPKNFLTYFLFPAAAGGSVSPKEGSPWRLSPLKSLTQLILLMNSLCIIFSLKGMGTCDSGPGQRDQRSADGYTQCREVTMLAPVAVTTRVAAQAGYFRHTLDRTLPCITAPQSIIGALLIPHNHWTIVFMIYRLIGTDSVWHSHNCRPDRGVLARRGSDAKCLDTSDPLCSPIRHFDLDKPPASR